MENFYLGGIALLRSARITFSSVLEYPFALGFFIGVVMLGFLYALINFDYPKRFKSLFVHADPYRCYQNVCTPRRDIMISRNEFMEFRHSLFSSQLYMLFSFLFFLMFLTILIWFG